MTYNGWKNWETWNVALWLGNDERLYRSVNKGAKLNASEAESLVRSLLPFGTVDFIATPDRRRKTRGGAAYYAVVDWKAIAGAINEMRGHG